MSKVISFRLNNDNLREAQAMEAIETWVSQGYSLRHILTESLIMYKKSGDECCRWESIYEQLSELISKMDSGEGKHKTVVKNTNDGQGLEWLKRVFLGTSEVSSVVAEP